MIGVTHHVNPYTHLTLAGDQDRMSPDFGSLWNRETGSCSMLFQERFARLS
jgi:hypothetical protein